MFRHQSISDAGNYFLTGEIEMNTLRRCVPALVLGLMIAFAGASFAQTANQASGDQKASCCCSCCGDSCPMMKKDAMKNHTTSSDKDDCGGCCGDSCDMKKKDGMKHHVVSADKDGCCGCCGNSCDIKNHAKTTSTTTNMSSEKHDCCCGDSCDMKDMKDVKPKP